MRLPLLLLFGLAACSEPDGPSDRDASGAASTGDWPVGFQLGAAEPRFERVVLVTIDTLRADHVSAYGYERETTPVLDSLAERGVLFERAMAAVSHTAPSHATMLTGLTPLEHGVEQNGHSMAEDANDLGQLFRAAGYETAAFLNVKFLRGVASTFDVVEVDKNGGPLVDRALRWLREEREGERFFLWLHLYGPHRWKDDDHVPPKALAAVTADDRTSDAERYARMEDSHGLPAPAADGTLELGWTAAIDGSERIAVRTVREYLDLIDAYDAHTRKADELTGLLYRTIEEELALGGTSLWILTSDHGEGLASHGVAGHGSRIYQEQLHVPLVVHASDGSIGPHRVDRLVQHVDLYPTVAELLGARVEGLDPVLHGASLVPLLDGASGWSDRPAFSQRRPFDEQAGGASRANEGDLFALQSDRYKYLLHEPGEDEFYDLEADPLELENLIGSDAREREALETLLRGRVDVYRARRLSGDDVEIPAEWLRELKDLGYVE